MKLHVDDNAHGAIRVHRPRLNGSSWRKAKIDVNSAVNVFSAVRMSQEKQQNMRKSRSFHPLISFFLGPLWKTNTSDRHILEDTAP